MASFLASSNYPNIPDTSSPPPPSFFFPERNFGSKKIVQRSCQRTWLEQWPWLYYSEGKDAWYCSMCINALKSKKIGKSRGDLLKIFPTGRMAQLALKSMKALESQGSSAGNDCNTINLP